MLASTHLIALAIYGGLHCHIEGAKNQVLLIQRALRVILIKIKQAERLVCRNKQTMDKEGQ